MKNIFQKIIDREIPSEIVFENDRFIAIKDIAPVAPVHLLIIPKKHIKNISDAKEVDKELLGEVFFIAQKLASSFGIEKGYRLITNNGSEAGQTVYHLHFHLIGGRILGHMA